MAAILNSNMADMKGEFRVAQYLKIFAIHQSTFVPNLMLVSQNAQSFWNLKLNRLTIISIRTIFHLWITCSILPTLLALKLIWTNTFSVEIKKC